MRFKLLVTCSSVLFALIVGVPASAQHTAPNLSASPSAAAPAIEPSLRSSVPPSPMNGNLPPFNHDTITNVIEQVLDTVVLISTSQNVDEEASPPVTSTDPDSSLDDFFKDYFDKQKQGETRSKPTGEGSGFVIDAQGTIVTNFHVIDGADKVEVNFNDGTRLPAEIIGKDKEMDLAVIRVKPRKPLLATRFGNSDDLRLGEWVVALGNPFGIGLSATSGIVSGRNRDIRSGRYDNFIQTDAAINKGNSGGPLFNLQGEVIGINTAILSPTGGSVGIGFAVPSNAARIIISQLITYGETRRGYIGVRIQDVTDDIASQIGLEKATGALLAGIVKDGPADKAGMKVGDVLLEFNGTKVASTRALQRIVADAGTENDVAAIVWRDGRQVTLTVRAGWLEEAEKRAALPDAEALMRTAKAQTVLGLKLTALDDNARKAFAIDRSIEKGLVITAIEDTSPLKDAKLEKGFVILELAQKTVTSAETLRNHLDEAKENGETSALMLVSSPKGEVRFLRVPVEQ